MHSATPINTEAVQQSQTSPWRTFYLPKKLGAETMLEDLGDGKWQVVTPKGIGYRKTKNLTDREPFIMGPDFGAVR